MVFLLSQWSLLRRMESHVIDSRAPNFFAQPPPVTAGAREDAFKAKWTPRGPGGPFVLLEDELSRGDWKVSLSRAPDSPTQRRAYQDKSMGCAMNHQLSGAPPHALLLRGPQSRPRRGLQHLRVYDVDRRAGGEGVDLVEDVGELQLPLLARDVADVRRADCVLKRQQRVLARAHRLVLVDVDRGHPGPACLQRCGQRARLDQPRPAGVDQQRGGLHR